MKLSDLAKRLADAGAESPMSEARMVFDALGQPTLSPDPDTEAAGISLLRVEEILRRRADGEPIQYILGVAWFYRESYLVSPACLIPRSDTEHLVEYAISHLPKNGRFLDMCTGSGCVAISILANRCDLTALAIDHSEAALAIAKENAMRNGVADRITFLLADAFSYLPSAPFDGFFSNPPYIQSAVVPTLAREVQREPHSALDGGEDGLCFYRHFCKNLSYYIYKEGICGMEIGYDQGEAIKTLASQFGLGCTVKQDFGGCDRLAILSL